jgi:hypothetical protein
MAGATSIASTVTTTMIIIDQGRVLRHAPDMTGAERKLLGDNRPKGMATRFAWTSGHPPLNDGRFRSNCTACGQAKTSNDDCRTVRED